MQLLYIYQFQVQIRGMIRQKRFSITRNPQNHTKVNIFSQRGQISSINNENQKLIEVQQTLESNQRGGLSQITTNLNIRDSFISKGRNHEIKMLHHNPLKHKENIFSKISELIRNQELPMPICQTNRMNNLKCVRERPFTSFSHTTKILDHGQLNKISVVLDLAKNQESLPPERSSTSRALMNYSKVYRNNSNDGFRVKKNPGFVNKYVHLSAQKVVFQEKQRKEKQQKSFERTINLKKSKKVKKAEQRYRQQEQQDFQIGGWDYFE